MLKQNTIPLDIIIHIIIIVICAIITYYILKKITNHYWSKYDIDPTGYHLFIEIIKYIIILVAFGWILKEIGIDLQGIFVSLGIAGIIIGLAAKDIFSNFMSGIFILSDKTIKKDEIIEIENVKGKVEKVTFRTTTLKTVDDFTVTVPNSVLNNKTYTVYKKLELNKIRLYLNVPYNINLNKFEKEFKKEILKYSWIIKEKTPYIKDVELTEYGYSIKFYIWVEEYDKISKYKIILAQDAEKVISDIGEHLKIST